MPLMLCHVPFTLLIFSPLEHIEELHIFVLKKKKKKKKKRVVLEYK